MFVQRLGIAALMSVPLAGFAASPASGNEINHHASAEGCISNCVMVLKHGGRHLLLAKDRDGELFRIEPLDIPANARFIGSNSQDYGLLGEGSGSGTQVVSTRTYTGPGGTWVVTTIVTYDAAGNITHVYSESKFFANEER